jgi:hypothetical protein
MFLCTRLCAGSSTLRGILSPKICGPENQEVKRRLLFNKEVIVLLRPEHVSSVQFDFGHTAVQLDL